MKQRVYFKDSKVVAIHELHQDVDDLYADCDCYVFQPEDYRVEDIDQFSGETIMRKLQAGDDMPVIANPVTAEVYDKDKIMKVLKKYAKEDFDDTVIKVKD